MNLFLYLYHQSNNHPTIPLPKSNLNTVLPKSVSPDGGIDSPNDIGTGSQSISSNDITSEVPTSSMTNDYIYQIQLNNITDEHVELISDILKLIMRDINDGSRQEYTIIRDLDDILDDDEISPIHFIDECVINPQPSIQDIPNTIEETTTPTPIQHHKHLKINRISIMNHSIISPQALSYVLNQELHQNLQHRIMMLNTQDGHEECTGHATDILLQHSDDIQELLHQFPEHITDLRCMAMEHVTTHIQASNLRGKSTKNSIRIHFDGGANCSITNNRSLLFNYEDILPIIIGGANAEVGIVVKGRGYMTIISDNGLVIPTPVYYSDKAEGTIVSMTDLVIKNKDIFDRWMQYTYPLAGFSTLHLRGNGETAIINCVMRNGLTYYNMPLPNQITMEKTDVDDNRLLLRALNSAQKFELWHQKLLHPDDHTMKIIHQHVTGVPKLIQNPFYKCPTCIKSKMRKQVHHGATNKVIQIPIDYATDYFEDEDDLNPILQADCVPGQHLHADFGFVRGSEFKEKNDKDTIVTSIQGYNSYLLIVDRKTRLITCFLRHDKQPAIEEFKDYIKRYGCRDASIARTVRTDQGGELWGSTDFQNTIIDLGYTLQPTGADSSHQNGLAENPHRNLAAMMRAILYNAGLSSKFWCFALMHAVYVKNRLPHRSINMTPYEARTGRKPDLSQLRIFGCRIYARKPGKRKAKLDMNYYKGIFLGFTSTTKNIHYYDLDSKLCKIASHVIFDEAGMTVHDAVLTPGYLALQTLGYEVSERLLKQQHQYDTGEVDIVLLSDDAKLPTKGSPEAAGYDVYSTDTYSIDPGTIQLIPIDISLKCPDNTYCRVAPRSGLTIKNQLDVKGGVIDKDFTGNITVIIHNFGQTTQIIQKGDKIAQLIFECIKHPTLNEVLQLPTTTRGANGFGSTDTILPSINKIHHNISGISDSDNDQHLREDLQHLIDLDEIPYTIELSHSRFDNELKINLEVLPADKNPFCGFKLKELNNRIIVEDILPGTSAARIPSWRSHLRNASILLFNKIPVKSINHLQELITEVKLQGKRIEIPIMFGTEHKLAIHPIKGVPQLYSDQLQLIDQHLYDIRDDLQRKQQQQQNIGDQIVSQNYDITQANRKQEVIFQIRMVNDYITPMIAKLTRRILQKQPDWSDWKQSESKQLNAYYTQNMFGEPCQLPPDSNVLPLLWTYLIKVDGTKKARCVCNGSPKNKGSVTLDQTYAGSLEQTGSRLFWAITSMKNYIAVGADVSNAFAEAGAPKAPLYVYIDRQYREWYFEKYGQHIDPKHTVLPVHKALQGHPESSRLWAKLINKLLITMNFQPCHHEPCLYRGFIDNHEIFFLRQVDDFAISSKTEDACKLLINNIQKQMSMEVHHLGIISWFNGVDVIQTQDFIQLNVNTYIEKILSKADWMDPNHHMAKTPLPMIGDNKYSKTLEAAVLPTNDMEREQIKHEMGFSYRKAIGELIYAMVTARPDISYPLVKLSQYSTNPAREHYLAVKDIYYYLKSTKSEGIYYWRTKRRKDLPNAPHPTLHSDNYEFKSSYTKESPDILIGASDATWGEDINHRRSVNGIILKLAGGVVYYKSNFQKTISLSTTESEYTAACEAGKAILYVRSILDDAGIDQMNATILYQDNAGAFYMGNAGKPSKRTRHIDMKLKVVELWVEQDLLIMHMIPTHINYADAMTKSLGKQLFYRHFDNIMGRRKPEYAENLATMKNMTTDLSSRFDTESMSHFYPTHPYKSTRPITAE